MTIPTPSSAMLLSRSMTVERTSTSHSSKASASPSRNSRSHKTMSPLFWHMEMGNWDKATERAKAHPREVKTWTSLRTKNAINDSVNVTKRLALHHACFKLRSVVESSTDSMEDPFVEVCRFILLLISLYPEAARERESRHGCMPIHLAAFASCAPRQEDYGATEHQANAMSDEVSVPSTGTDAMTSSMIGPDSPVIVPKTIGSGIVPRPSTLQVHQRSISEDTHGTCNTQGTNMTVIIGGEPSSGALSRTCQNYPSSPNGSRADFSTIQHVQRQPIVSVSMKSNVLISAKRENMAIQVINALLDAYPKGIRADSEGGRLPLHTACSGRATPRVISVILAAYLTAARQRNKDGYLPLHIAAHWGVSHPDVAVSLLKAYPDSTLGRNRWERTPLDEALCMAGENGRPHQEALVRTLRKHPTYWTRPSEELFQLPSGNVRGSNVVDMDETLPDDETSTTDEDGARRYYNSGQPQLLEEEGVEYGVRGIIDFPGHVSFDLQALIKRQQWDEIKARLESYPHEECKRFSTVTKGGFMAVEGFTPLHYAVERRPPVDVIQALIRAWPEALMTKLQPGGTLPLHIACTWSASTQVVSVLCLAEPGACVIPDELGNLALHHAAFAGAMVPVVDSLLRTFPNTVLARNRQGSLAVDICKRLRHANRRNVLALLKAGMEQLLSHHRSQSTGAMGNIVQQAMELNLSHGPPSPLGIPRLAPINGDDKSHESDSGIEVQMGTNSGGHGMIWI